MTIEGETMAKTGNSSLQRVQVGLIGLLAVLLFVSIANMMIDRIAPSRTNVNSASEATTGAGPAKEEVPNDEPLAELGVTPTVSSEEAPKNRPALQDPANGAVAR